MDKKTLLLVTDENRQKLKIHSVKSITQLQIALTRLKEDLNHNSDMIRENSIVIAAAICLAVEEAVKHATNELKINNRV